MSRKPDDILSNMPDAQARFQQDELDAWRRAAARSAPAGNLDALTWHTPDGIAVKPMYTARDTRDLAL